MSGGYVECGGGVDDDVGRHGDDGVQPPSAHADAGYVDVGAGNVGAGADAGVDVDGAGVHVEVANALGDLSVRNGKSEQGVVMGPSACDENASAIVGFGDGMQESSPAALEIYLCPPSQHVPFPSHDP